jgi:hypothetical protein
VFVGVSAGTLTTRIFFVALSYFKAPPRRPAFKPGSGQVGFCDGQKWRCCRFSPRTSVSPANLHYICFSTIIFTITRRWHNRPGVAAVPIASQAKKRKKKIQGKIWNNTSTKVTTASLRILFTAAFVNHTNIQRHVAQASCRRG